MSNLEPLQHCSCQARSSRSQSRKATECLLINSIFIQEAVSAAKVVSATLEWCWLPVSHSCPITDLYCSFGITWDLLSCRSQDNHTTCLGKHLNIMCSHRNNFICMTRSRQFSHSTEPFFCCLSIQYLIRWHKIEEFNAWVLENNKAEKLNSSLCT